MWWQRPWRWILELVASAVLLGLLNTLVKALGEPAFLGIGWAGRAAVLVGLTLAQDILVIPSPEKMDRGDPLPPLPTHQSSGSRRGWGAKE
ncbi:MAG TPA: hypothetical protein VJB57_05930 [Dehalococcoidia bacterium]|nr:hypothetical protein [Dehalococcoidia bacterium]